MIPQWTWSKQDELQGSLNPMAALDRFIRNVNVAMKKLESTLGLSVQTVQSAGTFADGSTTPNVGTASVWKTANSAPTAITDFPGGDPAKSFTLIAGDANTTINNTATIKTKTGANRALGAVGNVTQFVTHDGALWREVPTP